MKTSNTNKNKSKIEESQQEQPERQQCDRRPQTQEKREQKQEDTPRRLQHQQQQRHCFSGASFALHRIFYVFNLLFYLNDLAALYPLQSHCLSVNYREGSP